MDAPFLTVNLVGLTYREMMSVGEFIDGFEGDPKYEVTYPVTDDDEVRIEVRKK